jgi:hypothetical protein
MSKIAATYGPKELPKTATGAVARGLMVTGDSGGLETWMQGLDATERANLWDQAIGVRPSATEARLYLDKRPRDVPPNIWALSSAASALPDAEADEVLQLVDDAKGPAANVKQQARTLIASRRLSALITDAPEKVSEFLTAVRDEDRERVIEEVLYKGAEREVAAVRQWADECQDIALRARIENKIAENEIKFGDFAQVEKRVFGLLQVGASPQACVPVFNQLVTAYGSESAKVTALIQRLPAGELRDQMTVSFVQKWAESDPASASEWIAQLPPGRGRDLAVRELVISSRDDPARALANAAGIEDEKTRLEAARLVLRVWRDVDPAQAAALLPTAGFPATDLPALRAALGVEPSSNAQP